jgi:hypothetical protein
LCAFATRLHKMAMSKGAPATTTVRVEKAIVDRVNTLADELGMPAGQLVSICVEDCLAALETRGQITPRVVKLRRAMKLTLKKTGR